ncbi:IS3 family transposase [Bacillus cereus]|uniref:IS3 family transposase n=1 Tax=Bacillus cereus TaxID=1396 RepID=UPI0018F69E5A|nr:IS3 family transposase [Bacillus cereus]
MLKPNNIIIFVRNPRSTLTDEAYIKSCESFVQLKHEIKKYMTYYNQSRYQWNLKTMTPVCIQKSSS